MLRKHDRWWKQVWVFVSLACASLLLLLSCSVRQANSPASDRIKIGTTAQVKTLDPADAYEQSSAAVIYNLGDRLYTYIPGTTELQPQLAKALPTISADGLTYTIPLRQGVIFHDGTPFNAEAMAFSLKRFANNKGRPSFLLSSIVKSIAATKPDELTIQLQQPFAAFTSLLTFPGLCAVSPQAYELGEGKFKPDTFVGTGPYQLSQYGSDALRLEPFDRYWGTKPKNSGVDLQRFSSAANLYNAFRTGAVDVAYQTLDADQIRSLVELAPKAGWQTIAIESNAINYLVVNLKQPPFDRVEVRQAIAAAIDRSLLNDRVFYGQAQPLYSLIPPNFEASRPVFQTQYGDGNLDRAKTLLTQAGFSPQNPVVLEIWYPSDSSAGRLSATVLKAWLEKGLKGLVQVKPNSVESATAYGYLDKGVYPTFLLNWSADFFDADNYIKPFVECAKGSVKNGCEEGESQYHGSFYYSDRVNQLIAKQRIERNPNVRSNLFVELQNQVAQDVPFIPLWENKEYAFARSGITGVQLGSVQPLMPFAQIQKGQNSGSVSSLTAP
jgi:peptide/nickel transport system substrate-binding protein